MAVRKERRYKESKKVGKNKKFLEDLIAMMYGLVLGRDDV